MHLCEAHLGSEGIRDPIRCYEYLGRFYVQEGNKRVSVLKSFDAPTIPGHVTRLVPVWSEAPEIQRYYDFLQTYQRTGLYRVAFSRYGSFLKLQAALGFAPDHKWTQEERRYFLSGFTYFREAFLQLGGGQLPITAADALLVWLKVYPFQDLRTNTLPEILRRLTAIWPDVRVLGQPDPITVSTEPEEMPAEEQGLIGRLFSMVFPSHLTVAFLNELNPISSPWTRGA